MIKTVSINLGGIVFQIDEDAFEALRQYLDSVTRYYKYQEGRDEIVSDIEMRFAEIFTESLHKSGFDVISLKDVDEVIDIMGRPEDFDDDGERFSEGPTGDQRTYTGGKVLYRDKDNAVLAGVCSGLSAYWGIKDPLWLRLAFIATALFSAGTIGVVVYIILWIVVPEAKTSSQKLEMRGEPVNLSNLEKKIRYEVNEAGERITEFARDSGTRDGLRRIVDAIGRLFGAVARVAIVLIKILFAVVAMAVVVSLIITLLAMIFSFIVSIPLALKYIFAGPAVWVMAIIGGLFILIPALLGVFYIPFRLFGRRRIHNRKVSGIGVGTFIIGVILTFASATVVASYFSERESVSTQAILPVLPADTLYLGINRDVSEYEGLDYNLRFSNLMTFTRRLETASDKIELDIVESPDSTVYLERTYRSHGRTVNIARENAESINYSYEVDGNAVVFNQIFGLGEHKKWRNQSVRVRLKVPEGMVIVPDRNMSAILDNVANSRNAGVYTVAGNRWKMADGRLEPVDSLLNAGITWNKRNLEQLEFSDFNRLNISGNVEIELIQADRYEVYMAVNSADRDDIEISQSGNELRIDRDDWKWPSFSLWFLRGNRDRPEIYIALPEIEYISVHGLAHVQAPNKLVASSLDIDLHGQGSAYFDDLSGNDLTADLHGQSDLRLSGSVNNFNLEARGQSDVDGESFKVNKLFLKMTGQSDAEMIVEDYVEGNLSGQSDFEYWGNPEVDISSSGQADVDRRD